MTRVLIVDDDPHIVCTLRRVLSRHAFEVVAALDARSALAVFEPFEPDVVLSDLQMPGTGGEQLLAEMKRLRPGLRTVLMSGCNPARAPRNYPFVAKPWREDALLTALGRAKATFVICL